MRQKFVSHPIYQLTRTCVIRMLSFQVLKGCKRDEIKRRQLLIFSLLETSGEKGHTNALFKIPLIFTRIRIKVPFFNYLICTLRKDTDKNQFLSRTIIITAGL